MLIEKCFFLNPSLFNNQPPLRISSDFNYRSIINLHWYSVHISTIDTSSTPVDSRFIFQTLTYHQPPLRFGSYFNNLYLFSPHSEISPNTIGSSQSIRPYICIVFTWLLVDCFWLPWSLLIVDIVSLHEPSPFHIFM